MKNFLVVLLFASLAISAMAEDCTTGNSMGDQWAVPPGCQQCRGNGENVVALICDGGKDWHTQVCAGCEEVEECTIKCD
ncbi:hypothetical protein AAVH_26690 [Aphelenchoides avenae]|nr:hypothetical protein AAVH_26690 [Aphelenchus avenae]